MAGITQNKQKLDFQQKALFSLWSFNKSSRNVIMSRGGKISNNNNIDDSNKTNNNNNKIMIVGITEDIIGVTVNKCSY